MGGMCDHTRVPLQDLTGEGELTNARVGDGFSSTLFADAAIDFSLRKKKKPSLFSLCRVHRTTRSEEPARIIPADVL